MAPLSLLPPMKRIQYTFRYQHMKKINLFLLWFLVAASHSLLAQDTLPKFSLTNAGNNRIIIGWTNNFENIRQISIQRSFDSLKNYKTILTVPDPTTPQNGYVDTKADNDTMFYRLYIMLDKGIFLFSNPKRPFRDTTRVLTRYSDTIRMGDTFIIAKTFGFDPAKTTGTDSAALMKVISIPKPPGFIPSKYVYTNRDGYIRISLPENDLLKRYIIRFFDEDGTLLFELKDIHEKDFKLDKANFYHAGWFRFELYEEGKVVEKNKFYVGKDFKSP